MSIAQKKSLGQHFLRAQSVLNTMCTTAEIKPGDTVVEIGPGTGTLTTTLLNTGATVIALEKDHRLIPVLTQHFAIALAEKKLILKEKDVLEFNPLDISTTSYKIVANIPYYITGAILEKFLSAKKQPVTMTLLVQKEVARRIVARDGKESLLSISVKAYGEPQYIKTVSRNLFSPPPKVDSAILHIKNISKKNFSDETKEKKFFQLVKAGFGHKRKMLKNNIATLIQEYGLTSEEFFTDTNINISSRAEDVPLSQWIILAEKKFN